MKRTILSGLTVVTAISLMPVMAGADIFYLRGGGKIEGEVIQHKGDVIVLRVGGGEIGLATSLIERQEKAPSPMEQYRERAAAVANTAAGHVELARWCSRKLLSEQARKHYRLALQLDGDNAAARRALGYVRRGDKWLTGQQARQLKEARKADQTVRNHQYRFRSKQWASKLRTLSRGPFSQWQYSAEFSKARDEVLAISDPAAVEALRKILGKHSEESARLVAVEALGRIGGDDAALALVDMMTDDPDTEVYTRSREALSRLRSEKAQLAMSNIMRAGGEVARNRVAAAVADAGLTNTVPSLVRSLITLETRVIRHEPTEAQRSWIRVGTTYGYVADLEPVVAQAAVAFNPVIGYITSGALLDVRAYVEPWTERVTVTVKHPKVLAALQRISGQNFGYDIRAWRRWYGRYLVQQKEKKTGSARALRENAGQEPSE
ncbi:MAG: hypothetical protein GWP05_08160 [Anaerolineaceae bacterium]|nr:hypothetical protein [Anaerolineaceae bacterium]